MEWERAATFPDSPGSDLPALSVQELLISYAAPKVLLLTGDGNSRGLALTPCRTGMSIPPLASRYTWELSFLRMFALGGSVASRGGVQ